jgi:hypothetical protein
MMMNELNATQQKKEQGRDEGDNKKNARLVSPFFSHSVPIPPDLNRISRK